MKQLRIEPIGANVDVMTATNVVEALIEKGNNRIKKVCGGKGICATCHVKVLEGGNALSTLTERERATLARITGASSDSRLGCQAQVRLDGCVIEVPAGIYLESLADLESLIGRRAEAPLFHPITSQTLVPSGKIITRSIIMGLQNVDFNVVDVIQRSELAA